MNTVSRLLRPITALVGAALLVGCSGTTWTHARATPDYKPPKHINVAVSTQAEGEGIHEAVQDLCAALAGELESFGISATFVSSPAPYPSAELSVVQWNMGDRWKRYWNDKDGEGYIVVNVRVTSAEGRPGYYGVARGYVKGGFFGGSYLNSASEAGDSIAKAIATGVVQ